MKFIVVLACVAVAVIGTVQADEHEEKFMKAEETCAKKSGQSADVLAEAKKGHFKDGDNMGCFAECIFNEVGFVKDGKINPEALRAAAKSKGGPDAEKHVEIADKCMGKTGSDMCDTTHQIFKCYWEAVNA